MVEKHSYYENRLYDSNNSKNAVKGNTPPYWKQPLKLLHWYIHLIKNPASAVRQIVAADNIKIPLILIAINLISVLIASIICTITINIRYRLYFPWFHVPSATIIISAMLLALVFNFGFSGLLFVSTSIIFKEKAAFSKILALTGSKVVTDSLFLLAGSVFMLLGSLFFFLFTAAGNIISFTMLITAYNEETMLPADKKIYSFSCPLVLIFVIMIIILKAVSPLITGNSFWYTTLF